MAHESPAREIETAIKALMMTIDITELGSLCPPGFAIAEMSLLDLRAAAGSAAGSVNPDPRVAVSSMDAVRNRSDARHPGGIGRSHKKKEA